MKTLFHETPTENRDSILKKGLLPKKAVGMRAVFLSNIMPKVNPNFDIYEVDVEGLVIHEDYCQEGEENERWYMTFENIPRQNISLHKL